jgi:predicted DNA-binding transcriptional regulator YafY
MDRTERFYLIDRRPCGRARVQRGAFDGEGRCVLEVPFADPRELTMDILKFGPDVEVLGPAALRATFAGEVARMAKRDA